MDRLKTSVTCEPGLHTRKRVRSLRFLLLLLQVVLWGAAPVADAMLDAESARAVTHVESHSHSSCPRSHDHATCAICHFLQLFSAPGHGAKSVATTLRRRTPERPVRLAVRAADTASTPLPRGPPLGS
jgi:hypothetical protein